LLCIEDGLQGYYEFLCAGPKVDKADLTDYFWNIQRAELLEAVAHWIALELFKFFQE
jgi:hypothetical protein